MIETNRVTAKWEFYHWFFEPCLVEFNQEWLHPWKLTNDNGKSPCLIGDTVHLQMVVFSIVILVFGGVHHGTPFFWFVCLFVCLFVGWLVLMDGVRLAPLFCKVCYVSAILMTNALIFLLVHTWMYDSPKCLLLPCWINEKSFDWTWRTTIVFAYRYPLLHLLQNYCPFLPSPWNYLFFLPTQWLKNPRVAAWRSGSKTYTFTPQDGEGVTVGLQKYYLLATFSFSLTF